MTAIVEYFSLSVFQHFRLYAMFLRNVQEEGRIIHPELEFHFNIPLKYLLEPLVLNLRVEVPVPFHEVQVSIPVPCANLVAPVEGGSVQDHRGSLSKLATEAVSSAPLRRASILNDSQLNQTGSLLDLRMKTLALQTADVQDIHSHLRDPLGPTTVLRRPSVAVGDSSTANDSSPEQTMPTTIRVLSTELPPLREAMTTEEYEKYRVQRQLEEASTEEERRKYELEQEERKRKV